MSMKVAEIASAAGQHNTRRIIILRCRLTKAKSGKGIMGCIALSARDSFMPGKIRNPNKTYENNKRRRPETEVYKRANP